MSSLPLTGKPPDSETDNKQEVLRRSWIVRLVITKSPTVLPSPVTSRFRARSRHRGLNQRGEPNKEATIQTEECSAGMD
ncbi:hypothetical protein EYF80_038876 [Liparis tanakae]|uniref:Uncharacterized protein n=1 Tax=Liparis tanakae TaxID=230148 RepID=A0A4Z2GDF7_9TELE|nr:hypothetical protein EYF80_038876 [Liparis tanakae]